MQELTKQVILTSQETQANKETQKPEQAPIVFEDYNNSDIRTGWPFVVSKNYPDALLFAYSPAKRIESKNASAPGELGSFPAKRREQRRL